MTDAVRIRRAVESDVASLAKVAWQAFDEAFSDHPANRPEDMKAYMEKAFSEETLRGEMSDPANIYFVAEISGELVGYSKLTDGATERCVGSSRPIELSRLYCLDAFIGTGIGRSLMQTCLEFAKSNGNDVMWLGVWEFNYRAQEFYAKFGFSRCGEHVFLLGTDAQTDWVMSKSLDTST